MELSAIHGIGPVTEARLKEAGIATVDALANADAERTAEALGIPVERARAFIRDAQSLADRGTETWRVVLRDRAATAIVRANDALYENVPIVTARADEDDARLRAEVQHRAVLLKESHATAAVRLDDGAWRAGVPLYKEHMDAEGVTEIRVRVHEIRERHPRAPEPAPAGAGDAKKGIFSKLFGRK